MRTALITGITGQDGSYLAERLLQQGYRVYGLTTNRNSIRGERLRSFFSGIELVDGDLRDQSSLINALLRSKPEEVYNLAAVSFVPASWKEVELAAEVTGMGALRMLEAIRTVGGSGRKGGQRVNTIRFFQASSSEMFGRVQETPQSETTPFNPQTPHGAAKLYAHNLTISYRESFDIFACCGILFNHESPRRGMEFVTRKISNGVARIKLGKQGELILGNLNARRDWGFAGDYVEAMQLMLQQPEPEDYVVGTGEYHSVAEFAEIAFAHVGLNWTRYVRSDPRFVRSVESDYLADPTRIRNELGWKTTVSFRELVEMMVEADLALERGQKARGGWVL